jgi:pectate lyase
MASGMLPAYAERTGCGRTPMNQLGATALAFLAALPAKALPAFPGAEGYGAAARGGRGGAVHEVTTLADAGPGSLRACAEAEGPRTCVFRVAGTIALSRAIEVTQPYLTIAGQTAPGGGIALRFAGEVDSDAPIQVIGTHDVVIRHLRSRPGLSSDQAQQGDGILVMDSHDVVLDHVSLTWALDENLDIYRNSRDVTVQHSIMAEGLWPHSKGALVCSDVTTACGRITFHHNLFASNRDRNPDIESTPGMPVDVVNNVMYNAYGEYLEVWGSYGGARVNAVSNSFRRGPWGGGAAITVQDRYGGGSSRVHARGNDLEDIEPQQGGWASTFVAAPVAPYSVAPAPADLAFAKVLVQAGALPRDEADAAIVADVVNRTGRKLYEPPPYPELAAGTAPADGDRDGMPDAWEAAHGLDPQDPADRNTDPDGDGYTALEVYLADAAQHLAR